MVAPGNTTTPPMAFLDWYDDPPEPDDPPLYADDEGDEPETWDTHPSLTAEQRNSRMHCQ
jgi:hypothetical protein